MKRNDSAAVEATHALKAEAVAMKENLLKGDFEGLVESVRAGWEAKKRMAKSISNPQIDETYELARKAGMRAGKISGAGGGGFMMLLVDPVRRMDVVRALAADPGAGLHLPLHEIRDRGMENLLTRPIREQLRETAANLLAMAGDEQLLATVAGTANACVEALRAATRSSSPAMAAAPPMPSIWPASWSAGSRTIVPGLPPSR